MPGKRPVSCFERLPTVARICHLDPIGQDCTRLAVGSLKPLNSFVYTGFIDVLNGGLAGTRTPDQCLKRALLYQLSYQPNGAQKIKQNGLNASLFGRQNTTGSFSLPHWEHRERSTSASSV